MEIGYEAFWGRIEVHMGTPELLMKWDNLIKKIFRS